jgi:dTDP-4-dehydrorhamnose reductase
VKLLVTGAHGQVGWELARSLVPLGEVVALTRADLDLADLDRVADTVRALRPDVIVNAAAYTAVDRAESEPALADAVNGAAVGLLADEARRAGALLLHYSTDYVFDGTKQGAYVETDPIAPLNAYGRSKAIGEAAIAASGCRGYVLRTTWVYGSRGNNFLQTIRRLASERDLLRVVADQYGAPTSARYISDASAQIVRQLTIEKNDHAAPGVYHLTAAGRTTWHGFAEAIVSGLRNTAATLRVKSVEPIQSDAYATLARRPTNSVLDNGHITDSFRIHRPDWTDLLRLVVSESTVR